MATIKSFTSLEQSKTLSKILPLESADMMYSPPMLTHFKNYGDADKEQELPDYMVILVRRNIINDSEFDEPIPIKKGDFPCWSLAALLGVIKEQGLVDLRFLQSTFDNRGNHLTNVWCCTFENLGTVTLDLYAGNPIDACYEMILKLKELNLL